MMKRRSWERYMNKKAEIKAEIAKVIAELCEEYECDEEDLPDEDYWEARNEVYRSYGYKDGDPMAPDTWMPTRYDPACRP